MNRARFIALLTVGVLVYSASASRAQVEVAVALPAAAKRGPVPGTSAQINPDTTLAAMNGRAAVGLRLVVVDDGCDAKGGIAAANKIVSKGIMFVIGHLCSDAAMAASPIYEEAGVLMITASGTAADLKGRGFVNIFRTGGSDDLHGETGARFILEQFSPARVAVIHDGRPYGRTLALKAHATFRNAGVQPSVIEAITPGVKNFAETVELLNRRKIQAVYFGGDHVDLAGLVRQARRSGSSARFMAGGAAASSAFWDLAGRDGEGTLFTHRQEGTSESAQPSSDGTETHALGLQAAAQLLASAIARVGPEADRVAATLRTTSTETVLGELSFDAEGNPKEKKLAVYHWVDGAFVLTRN